MVSPYLPHALYAIAVTSISIHIVNQRRTSEEDRTRCQARISILEQIKAHLQSTEPVSQDELNRLKKLARPPDVESHKLPESTIEWWDIFNGRKLPSGEQELSKWDKKDLEKLKSAMEEK